MLPTYQKFAWNHTTSASLKKTLLQNRTYEENKLIFFLLHNKIVLHSLSICKI